MRWLVVAHDKEIPNFYSLATNDWQPIVLGVGQFAALARLSALLSSNPHPEGIVLIGTAGCLGSDAVDRIYQVQHFAYPSIAGEELPEFLPRACETEPVVRAGSGTGAGELPLATVVQNHGVSIDAEKFLLNTRYVPPQYPRPILENMEATALAMLCNAYKLAFSALLYTTNTIDPGARLQWQKQHALAGEKLAGLLQDILL